VVLEEKIFERRGSLKSERLQVYFWHINTYRLGSSAFLELGCDLATYVDGT